MPLRNLTKRKSNDSLANSSEDNKFLKKAALFRVDPNGKILANNEGVFLLNPSALEESKSSNWNAHNVPGQSDPPLQWTASGPRTITFEALVTKDTSYFDEVDNASNSSSTTIVSKIASSIANISPIVARTSAKTKATKGNGLDISNNLNYYRSLLYPEYDNIINPKRLVQSPPLLVLYEGRSIIKVPYEGRISAQHDVWVLTDLRIRITKQLPNLAPMEATVQFSLMQYNIRSFDHRRFTK